MKKISKGVFLSIAGAIVLVLRAFGVKIDAPYVNEIIQAVCALLIVLGVVTTAKPAKDVENNGEEVKKEESGEENKGEKDGETENTVETEEPENSTDEDVGI